MAPPTWIIPFFPKYTAHILEIWHHSPQHGSSHICRIKYTVMQILEMWLNFPSIAPAIYAILSTHAPISVN